MLRKLRSKICREIAFPYARRDVSALFVVLERVENFSLRRVATLQRVVKSKARAKFGDFERGDDDSGFVRVRRRSNRRVAPDDAFELPARANFVERLAKRVDQRRLRKRVFLLVGLLAEEEPPPSSPRAAKTSAHSPRRNRRRRRRAPLKRRPIRRGGTAVVAARR